jgi:predicted SnoaL-like aldol condensation-catalyzing enzyme
MTNTRKWALLSLILFSGLAFANNKQIVKSFYETAFINHKPEEAMKKYVGAKYIQHNPHVQDGPEPFISYFTGFFKSHPSATTSIKRIVAEGNLVVVHAHSRASDSVPGYAAIDIFRLENGKIVEHWDSVQAVPEKSANSNTMF